MKALRFCICVWFMFSSMEAASQETRPPWEGEYKIKPQETERLTPADVVGPDGIVYPNWTKCGVQGGIPDVKNSVKIEEFGGKPADDLDDSQALDAACRAVGENGGGAVVLQAGTYYLDWPVTVRQDKVVIRGAGREKARLIFRYKIPESGVGFYTLKPGSRIGKNTPVQIHCRPANLMKIKMLIDDQIVRTWERSKHSGNSFVCSARGADLIRKVKNGKHILKGIAEYKNGKILTAQIPVVLDSGYKEAAPAPNIRAAIMFEGRGTTGRKIKLQQDGKRGDLRLIVENTRGLSAGDCIYIDGPATQRWKTLTQNACKWGLYRNYEVRIEKVEGKTITINQPLRIEFPVIDGSYVQKIEPIQYGGVEDLYIEQTENLWISTVVFANAWNCWARGVKVKMCGRFPVYGSMAKWCEIRDCVFDDAWFKGGGGTAYTGWDRCWDCLIENIETFKMRHAPLFQWAAGGNVIRKGVFHESDAQWHAGWTNENLMEQCVVTSVRGHGGYGYGMWASPPRDTAHGPNGPRNVVYNCDVSSQRAGLWMGGMNENWLILYNRFTVEKGQGVFATTASFDHIIRENVFILKDKTSPMVFLGSPDCIGVEIEDNHLYGGSGKVFSGKAKAERLQGNKTYPLGEAARPKPPVPSIYEWQNAPNRRMR
jgi:hypothetical protein